VSCVKKLRRSDIDEFNPCGDQVTHFISWMKSFNATNSAYNGKKANTTFETRLITCILLTNEGKNR
jgi:hypothetical protein